MSHRFAGVDAKDRCQRCGTRWREDDLRAFGLRRREAAMLDMQDWRRNPRATQYRRFGAVQVRYGKAVNGSPPRRRTVLTVPETDWIVEVLEHWVDEVRPQFGPGGHPAMWMTERRGRIAVRTLDEVFAEIRSAARLPTEVDLHFLRHSYVTHLLEFGYPELIPMPPPRPSTPRLVTSSATGCWSSRFSARPTRERRGDQDNVVSVASAAVDGHPRTVPDQ